LINRELWFLTHQLGWLFNLSFLEKQEPGLSARPGLAGKDDDKQGALENSR